MGAGVRDAFPPPSVYGGVVGAFVFACAGGLAFCQVVSWHGLCIYVGQNELNS